MFHWRLALLALTFSLCTTPLWASEKPSILTDTIQLADRNLSITIFYSANNEVWARSTLETTKRALPVLERCAGFPYPYYFPVMIHESNYNETVGRAGKNIWRLNKSSHQWARHILLVPQDVTELQIIHELAHYWNLYDEIWMMEGFSQYYAYKTLKDLKGDTVAEKYYSEMLSTLQENPSLDRPLNQWQWNSELEELFLYRKSFFFVKMLVDRFGLETIQNINRNIYASEGVIPYDPRDFGVADFKRFKSLLEETTGEGLDRFFSGWVTEGSYYYKNDTVSFSWWLIDDNGDNVPNIEDYNAHSAETGLFQTLRNSAEKIIDKFWSWFRFHFYSKTS